MLNSRNDQMSVIYLKNGMTIACLSLYYFGGFTYAESDPQVNL